MKTLSIKEPWLTDAAVYDDRVARGPAEVVCVGDTK